MNTLNSSERPKRAAKPFWEKNAFWFVAMPTSLVALVFLLALVVQALGQ